jgi:hypothetical protein
MAVRYPKKGGGACSAGSAPDRIAFPGDGQFEKNLDIRALLYLNIYLMVS